MEDSLSTSPEIRELCSKFGYPAELQQLLIDLRMLVQRACGNSLRSLIVCGSLATGDFVWTREAESIRFFSDIDVMLFVQGLVHTVHLDEAIGILNNSPARTPLFHVDVSVRPISAVNRLPYSFQAVEIRKAGWVLAGEDLRWRFPEQFDPASAREAFFCNLWKPLLFRTVKDSQPDLYRHAIARQILDVAILAHSEQGKCIPGHRQRVAAFLNLPKKHPLAISRLRTALTHAFEVRQGTSVDLHELEGDQDVAIQTAVEFLKMRIELDVDAPISPEHIAELLRPRTLRRICGELRNELVAHRIDLAWILRRKEALAAAAALAIYRSRLEGSHMALTTAACQWLTQFSGQPLTDTNGGPQALALLKSYWAGELRLHPSARKNRHWIEPLLEPAYV